MTIIAPFRGLTYSPSLCNEMPKLAAPPYDVMSPEEQDAFHHAHPLNVIRLILGKKRTGDSDWDNCYTRAAEAFERWQSTGALVQSKVPCMYVTSMTYAPGKGEAERTRWGLIAVVRIEDPASGVILPHERTFSAHKDDRLRLMRACRAQFSQIFGLYEDPAGQVMETLEGVISAAPQLDFPFQDGTGHRMWSVDDPAIFKRIAEIMRDKRIFIADGHHRYETARNYRNLMRTRFGGQPSERSYEYVMIYLSNMSDKGLTILPSHRMIKACAGFDRDDFVRKAAEWFRLETLDMAECSAESGFKTLQEKLAAVGAGTTAFAMVLSGDERILMMSLKPGARAAMGDELHPALKNLDVLVLSRLVFQRCLGFGEADMDNSDIFQYQSNFGKAVSQVREGIYRMGFLLNPTRIEHVREVADNALVMPRKSTFFYPKVLTGLVFNKLDPDDVIQVP